MILMLCERFKALPSAVKEEEADIIRMMKVYELGHREKGGG